MIISNVSISRTTDIGGYHEKDPDGRPRGPYPRRRGGGWHGGGYYHGGGWHGGYAGPAIAAGIAGLAVGAALAGPHYGYAYGPGPYYGYPYGGVCFAPRRVWDPYAGVWVVQNVRYAC
jgi:hypothetical protein